MLICVKCNELKNSVEEHFCSDDTDDCMEVDHYIDDRNGLNRFLTNPQISFDWKADLTFSMIDEEA